MILVAEILDPFKKAIKELEGALHTRTFF
jgi:hypothetical protein